jgi:hypothetical protein
MDDWIMSNLKFWIISTLHYWRLNFNSNIIIENAVPTNLRKSKYNSIRFKSKIKFDKTTNNHLAFSSVHKRVIGI